MVVSCHPLGECPPFWDSRRERQICTVCTRYGPVSTCPQEFPYVEAQAQTANEGVLSVIIEAQLRWFFESGGQGNYSVQCVFDSLLLGHLTLAIGRRARKQGWAAPSNLSQNPRTSAGARRGRTKRRSSVVGLGDIANITQIGSSMTADKAAKCGTLGFSMQRRLYEFTTIVDQLALLAAEYEVYCIL